MLAKTQDAASEGRYELFKTTSYFDTAKHPDFLGGDTLPVQRLSPMGNG